MFLQFMNSFYDWFFSPVFSPQWWKCEEPNVAQEEIPVVEVTEIKNVGDGAIRVSFPFYLQGSLSSHKDYYY